MDHWRPAELGPSERLLIGHFAGSMRVPRVRRDLHTMFIIFRLQWIYQMTLCKPVQLLEYMIKPQPEPLLSAHCPPLEC